jgi:hypothetical protein
MCLLVCFKLIRHIPVFTSRGQLKNLEFPESQIVTVSCLKVIMYPSSYNCPTESKEGCTIPGKTCDLDASAFISGMYKSAV